MVQLMCFVIFIPFLFMTYGGCLIYLWKVSFGIEHGDRGWETEKLVLGMKPWNGDSGKFTLYRRTILIPQVSRSYFYVGVDDR